MTRRPSTALLSYVLPVIAVVVVAFGYAQYSHASSQNYLCKRSWLVGAKMLEHCQLGTEYGA